MRTVEATKGRWKDILNYYRLPPITGKKHYHGKCPICSRIGKFRIDNKNDNGSWICLCGAGDGWKLLKLTQKKEFKTLATEIDKIIGNDSLYKIKKNVFLDAETLHSKVIKKFISLINIKNTSANKYFHHRGIYVLPKNNIKFNPCEKTPFGIKQSIWSIATDNNGNGCYLHRTILDGERKANFEGNKRMLKIQEDNYLSFAKSIAIRMFPVSSTIGIAEGIETALSCKQIYGCNTWSTLNAGFMRKFQAPKGVKHLIIFADKDNSGTGLASAFDCGNKNILSNNDVEMVSIRWPEKGDFNDMILNGLKVFQEQFHRHKND